MRAEDACTTLVDYLTRVMDSFAGCWYTGCWGRLFYDGNMEAWHLLVWPLARDLAELTGMTEEENADADAEGDMHLVTEFANFDFLNVFTRARELAHTVESCAYAQQAEAFSICIIDSARNERFLLTLHLNAHDADIGDWDEGIEFATHITEETTTAEIRAVVGLDERAPFIPETLSAMPQRTGRELRAIQLEQEGD